MKNTQVRLAVATVFSLFAANAAEDFVITEGGSVNIPSGSGPYALLQNNAPRVSSKVQPVTLMQDSLDYQTVFSGFRAAEYTSTTFDGVNFDFGGGDFLTGGLQQRTVTLTGGSVITNVATLTPGASSYNTINMDGEATLYVSGDVTIGASAYPVSHDRFNISGGSRLFVGGQLQVGPQRGGADQFWDTDNHLDLSGKGSYVKAGRLLIGASLNDNAEAAGGGNCSVKVRDNARMDLSSGISIGMGNRSRNDALYISDGGVVTAAFAHVSTFYDTSASTIPSANHTLQVLDGGELYLTEEFQMGYSSTGRNGMSGASLIVSNGTFSANSAQFFYSGVRNTNYEVRVSGPRAKFTVRTPPPGVYSLFTQPYNRFIVENGANYRWPYGSFSHMAVTRNESLIVRGEGTLFQFGRVNLSTSARKDTSADVPTSVSNVFYVASGAVATGGMCYVNGKCGELAIADATLYVTNNAYATIDHEPIRDKIPALTVGLHHSDYGSSTNCLVTLSGSSPRLRCVNGSSADFRRSAKLVFNLPAQGYAEVPFAVDNRLKISDSCEIILNGLAEMLPALEKTSSGMTLVSAKTLVVSEAMLDKTRATLPDGCTLKLKGKAGVRQNLVLDVKRGLTLIVR